MNPDVRYHSALPGMVWPSFPAPVAANKLGLLFQMEQNQWLPQEEIAARQFDQVREILGFAATTVPYYRRLLGADFSPRDIDPHNWLEVPPLSRKVLHESPAALRSDNTPKEHGQSFPVRTSGSTGMMVEVLGTDLTGLLWQVFCLRDHLWHRRDLGQTLCSIRYQRDPALKGPRGAVAKGWGPATDDVAVTGRSVNYDILLGVAHLAERLRMDRPAYLLTHPSLVSGLARHCMEHAVALPGLREVRTMGESPDDSLRSLCRQAWNAP